MSWFKRILAGALTVAVIGVSGAGALNYIRKSREVEVLVVPVESLANDYYAQDTMLEGTVTTNVSQNIRVDQDMIVESLHVSEGDEVKKGELLVTFDMTLVEMELNIARLKRQLMERDLDKAYKRLKSLKNGGPIVESESGTGTGSSIGSEDGSIDGNGSSGIDTDEMSPSSSILDDLGYLGSGSEGHLLASLYNNHILALVDEMWDEDITALELTEDEEDMPEGSDTGSSDFEDDFIDDSEGIWIQPDAGQNNESGDHNLPEIETDDDPSQFLGYLLFYKVLDDTSVPITGTGTEEDPFIFLCTSFEEKVIAKGAFLNKMAGYNADGSEILQEGGYWYQLEFHQDDAVSDLLKREESMLGYYLVDGGMLEKPVPADSEIDYLIEEAVKYQPPIIDPGYWDGPGGGGGGSSSISREDAIKAQENYIASLTLDIKESDLKIAKLERKVANKEVYSKLDGIVASLDGSSGNSSKPFMSIKSKDGYFVKGMVSELQLNDINIGTRLKCNSYRSGVFDAEIISVADYPIQSNYGFYGGDSNPNVSNYQFTAAIEDQTLKFSDGDWIQITVEQKEDHSQEIVLSRAFVRSENGHNFVYISDNGKLKKQYVKVEGSADFGYSVIISAGLSRQNYIAFPYGKTVIEGAKTRIGTADELYQY